MKISDFIPGKVYVITRGNFEFKAGDHIWFDEDGSLRCSEAMNGWIDKEDITDELMDFDAKPYFQKKEGN